MNRFLSLAKDGLSGRGSFEEMACANLAKSHWKTVTELTQLSPETRREYLASLEDSFSPEKGLTVKRAVSKIVRNS
jgi:hypothetical protein